MWRADEIEIEVDDVEQSVMIVRVTVPTCSIEIIGQMSKIGRVLRVEKAHVQGSSAGAIGRAGLNAIARKFLEEADADELVVEGGTRTVGPAAGRIPRAIRFPR